MKHFFLVVLVVGLAAGCKTVPSENGQLPQQLGKISENIKPVKLCEVVDRSNEYNGKQIWISAVLITGREATYLYDPDCSSKPYAVFYEFQNDDVANSVHALLTPEDPEYRRVGLMRLTGEFYGTFESKVDAGFGHLGDFDTKLSIEKTEGVHTASDNVPYPSWR